MWLRNRYSAVRVGHRHGKLAGGGWCQKHGEDTSNVAAVFKCIADDMSDAN